MSIMKNTNSNDKVNKYQRLKCIIQLICVFQDISLMKELKTLKKKY